MIEYQYLLKECNNLKEENEQVKSKYRKSLQQLMHILKVNKSLKQCLDQNTKEMQQNIVNKMKEVKMKHEQELQTYMKQMEDYKSMYHRQSIERQKKQRQIQVISNELSNAKMQILEMQKKMNELNINNAFKQNGIQFSGEEGKDKHLIRNKLLNYLQLVKDKQQLQNQNEHLKQSINKLNIELIRQRDRFRSDIFSKQTELLRSKETDYQKLKTIESKYQLLQSQLNNYKNVEKYFEDEANVLLDEESIYNSIRQQISKINQDFNKYQLQSSNLLLKKRQEDAERNRKIVGLQKQVLRLKFIEQKLVQKQRQVDQGRKQKEVLRQKIKHLEQEIKMYVQKNNVLQALTMTQKHRNNPPLAQKIHEFQTRIKLLLQQNPKQLLNTKNNPQQTIILKGYIRQMSELLKQSKRKQDHLYRKNQQYKQKLLNAQNIFKDKLNEYKIKIKNYDILINKLYGVLEDKFKEKLVPEEIQKQFNAAIVQYESKMIQMSDEILKLRAKVIENEAKQELQNNNHVSTLEIQNQTFKEIISELTIRINQLQKNNKKVQKQEFENELKEKNKIIDELALQLNILNASLNDIKQKQSNMDEIVQNYENKIIKYKQQLQQKQKISVNLSRNSIDTATLIEKINYLQYEINKYKTKAEPTPKPDEFVKGLQTKLSLQNLQLNEYKQQIDKLYAQLKTQKTQKKSSVADQYSLITQLQQQITDGQIKILNIQNQFHNKQARYKDEIESYKYQNKALIQQLNSKHSQMMVYYEQLNKKLFNDQIAQLVPQLQQRIDELQQKNQDIIQRFSLQAKQLNSHILVLRTANLGLRNELQNKQDAINQLKHQMFNAELRTQKQKSISGSMIKSVSGSMIKQSIKEDDRNLTLIVLLKAQIDALRTQVQFLKSKNDQLEAMYHQDLDKYKQALKLLQARQMQLCNSLNLSSNEMQENKQGKPFSILHLSQQEISHISQNSTNFLIEGKPLQNTIRSYEFTKLQPKIQSSISIADSTPSKRRLVSIKKIS